MIGRVLIVAPSVRAAKPFESILDPAGFEVAVASRLEDAILLCREGTFDVVVLEGADPGSLGLCRHIRETSPAVMILVATDAGQPLQRLRALDAGADECLSGPASPSTLVMRTRSLVRAAALCGEASRMSAPKGSSPDMPLANPRRILILDPCERSRCRLTEILSPFGELSSNGDPSDGLAGAAEASPDLALVSLEWPGGDGIEIIRRMRLVARRRDLPVLAIANDQDLPARLCVEAGIRDRLLRPIDRSEAVMRTGLALRAARFSSGFADSGGFAPVPTLHRLNRRSRRLPPERFAA
jgi:two-component system, cell cycle response regulator